MVVLEVIILILLLLASTFFIGKTIGQRKHKEVLNQMKALELKYEHMLLDMEKSSIHCSDIIGAETDKFIELLNIIDQKCIYANDIIANLDETGDVLKQKSLLKQPTLKTITPTNDDKVFRDELKEALTTMFAKIVDVEERINQIELKQTAVSSSIREGAEQNSQLNNMYSELQSLVKKLDNIDQEANNNDDDSNVITVSEFQHSTKINEHHNEPAIPQVELKTELPNPVIEDIPKSIVPCHSINKRNSSSGETNTIVHEVLKQIEDGIAIPQIARSLGIGKGEIDLILNIYGKSKMKGNMEKCL